MGRGGQPPSPVAHAASDTAQDVSGFPGLPAHVASSYPASLPPNSSRQGFSPSHHPHPALISGIVLIHVPTLSLTLLTPTRLPREPCPWTGQPGQRTLVQVPLGAIPSFLSVTSSSGAALYHPSGPCCTPLSPSQCPQSNPGYIPGAPRALGVPICPPGAFPVSHLPFSRASPTHPTVHSWLRPPVLPSSPLSPSIPRVAA